MVSRSNTNNFHRDQEYIAAMVLQEYYFRPKDFPLKMNLERNDTYFCF